MGRPGSNLQSFIIVMVSINIPHTDQDGFTKDELRRWTVPQLSIFLKDRAVVIFSEWRQKRATIITGCMKNIANEQNSFE